MSPLQTLAQARIPPGGLLRGPKPSAPACPHPCPLPCRTPQRRTRHAGAQPAAANAVWRRAVTSASELSPRGHRVLGGLGWGSTAGPFPHSQTHRDPSPHAPRPVGIPPREGLPLSPLCPSPPPRPQRPQAHRAPHAPSPTPSSPPAPPPHTGSQLPSPPQVPDKVTGDGNRGRDAGARPLLTGAGGCPVPPRRRRGERIPQRPPRRPPPAPRRPAPDGSGRPSGLYVGPGLANERGEGRRCQWRAGRWGCAALIYCPKLQWKHGRAAPLDTEPKYYGGTRWGMRRERGS